ncbi:MAG: hypothetical protein NC828_06385 [Candidatus Omnitrophica bacterium]|nr:hypothetical protein [Candidatus Omnitrophota bacterium]
MEQVDGSHHDWFENRGPKCVLMGYIDDANITTYSPDSIILRAPSHSWTALSATYENTAFPRAYTWTGTRRIR